MNYLAHARLSFDQPQVLVGNMISDYIKGKKQFDYLPDIQIGIKLHRAIDMFTDEHPVTQKAKTFFRENYHLYSGAFIDIVYDHFLALDTNEFKTPEHLKIFSIDTYQTLGNHIHLTPPPFQQLFPYMQQHNWLYNYRNPQFIERSFRGLQHRAKYITETETAFAIFTDNYVSLQECYTEFYPLLKLFAAHQLQQLSKS